MTDLERQVLEMMAGTREGAWGSWVSACLEFLVEGGYAAQAGTKYTITDKGRDAL